MRKQENIYVSLQLDKDASSGEIVLNIQFDRNAPNFFTNKNTLSWSPTNEELEFINEAYGMLSKKKHQGQHTDGQHAEHEDTRSEELIRDADEKEILDRVFEKKRPAYNQ